MNFGRRCDSDALAVLSRLREAGHVAYFAGGCVRDLLLGLDPKDWDVATDAPPERVRELFPHSQAVGAAFGVVLVRRRRRHVEVATFRADGVYLDGRRPTTVQFTTAQDDAQRRDFTINGLFLDPLAASDREDGVIDFVNGRSDISHRILRAIGEPERRFEDDHLRMLRAVRFAARLNLTIEPQTAAAIRRHAPRLARIAPERVGEELRTMFTASTRGRAWGLLHELGLAAVLFRFHDPPPGKPDAIRPWDGFFSRVAAERPISSALAMAAAGLQHAWWALPEGRDPRSIFDKASAARMAAAMRRAMKLSNEESEAMVGAIGGLATLTADAPPGEAVLKRFLARPTADASRALLAALSGVLDSDRVAWLEARLSDLEQTDFAPAPLLNGDDLTSAGWRPGPIFKRVLDAVYDAQLEGRVASKSQAMEMAARERATMNDSQ